MKRNLKVLISLKKTAFTLAEVLITLSIVGVVAVLTIPGVVKNYKNRLYVAQLQKASSQLENAIQSMMNDEHVDNFIETKAVLSSVNDNGTTVAGWKYFLDNYLKTAKKDCSYDKTDKCVGASYKSMSGTDAGVISSYCVQTVNGAAICLSYNTTNKVPTVMIDVNGTAEPNIAGRDAFLVDIQPDGTLKDPGDASTCSQFHEGWGEGSAAAYLSGCYANIVNAGWKMEY